MADKDIWFPAKTHGWGWGPPVTWQGWLVLLAFIAVIVGIAVTLPPNREPVLFWVALALACAALTAICWWKGEPPRWRWGPYGKR